MAFFSKTLYDESFAMSHVIQPPLPEGETYYPFQAPGVWSMARTLKHRLPAVLCADEPGLGKTIQAIGVANVLGLSDILVVCPATIRENWAEALETWHVHNRGIFLNQSGATRLGRQFRTVVTSYDLCSRLVGRYKPQMLIVDEVHHIKNPGAKRTPTILGDFTKDWPGFVHNTPTVFLSGTPFPNGKPSELWPLLYRCVPDVINGLKLWPFIIRYCSWLGTGPGDYKVTGTNTNATDLNNRLRGSGFMVRREKSAVLKDLPPKQHKMVCFEANGALKKIVDRESKVSSKDISNLGSPIGSGLPEIRHEMGLAIAPLAINYIKDHFASGGGKALVFAHHKDVIELLAKGLSEFGVLSITGATPQAKRHSIAKEFQTNPNKRVFIGNQAAAEGITLTAAADVFIVEPDWVPGVNDQRVDRAHRIGQLKQVVIHYMVVKGSIGLKILYTSLKKKEDTEKLLTGASYIL